MPRTELIRSVIREWRQGKDYAAIGQAYGLSERRVKDYLCTARRKGIAGLTYRNWPVSQSGDGWEILMRRIMEEAL